MVVLCVVSALQGIQRIRVGQTGE